MKHEVNYTKIIDILNDKDYEDAQIHLGLRDKLGMLITYIPTTKYYVKRMLLIGTAQQVDWSLEVETTPHGTTIFISPLK